MGKIDIAAQTLAGLIYLAFCGPGCRPRTEPAVASHGGVSMTLTLDVDFGTIAPSETTERVIQLPNSFSTSVKPMSVVSSCKCLDALVEKRLYVPGEKIPVRVLIQTSSQTSTINQRLEISMDDAQETKYILRVRARVQGAFDLRPSGVLLKSGQESFIDVFNFSGKAWATPSVYAKADWIQLEIVPESRHETDSETKGATQHWRCVVKSALESVDPGKHASVIVVSVPEIQEIREVPAHAIVVPRISSFPRSLKFRRGGDTAMKLYVSCSHGFDLDIDGLNVFLSDSVKPVLDWKVKKKSREMNSIAIEFQCRQFLERAAGGAVTFSFRGDPAELVVPVEFVD